MITGIALSIILAGIIFAFYIMDFYFMLQHDRSREKKGKGWSWDYTLLTLGAFVLTLLQPVIFPVIGFSTSSGWGALMQAVGGIGALMGFIVHIWARQHLRHFYTERVEIQPNHKVIDTGPYALMRHPIITSFFLLAGGVFLINPAITTLLIVVYTVWSFSDSAKKEETELSKNVPGYASYLERTPRFFPCLWKK